MISTPKENIFQPMVSSSLEDCRVFSVPKIMQNMEVVDQLRTGRALDIGNILGFQI
jgi:hypothetical protein